MSESEATGPTAIHSDQRTPEKPRDERPAHRPMRSLRAQCRPELSNGCNRFGSYPMTIRKAEAVDAAEVFGCLRGNKTVTSQPDNNARRATAQPDSLTDRHIGTYRHSQNDRYNQASRIPPCDKQRGLASDRLSVERLKLICATIVSHPGTFWRERAAGTEGTFNGVAQRVSRSPRPLFSGERGWG